MKKYKYELWNGKEVLGYYQTTSILYGTHLVLPAHRSASIEIPIISRVVLDTGTERRIRICLDVRKKSARQIELIKNSDDNT